MECYQSLLNAGTLDHTSGANCENLLLYGEDFNRQLRKVTKSKSVSPTDDSLLKMLYLAMMDITKKWTGRRQDWSRIHAQLSIYFAERMPD